MNTKYILAKQNNQYYLFWFVLFGICTILYQQIQDTWRPSYSGNNNFILYMLGVAPNFFPGIGLPAIFLLLIPFVKAKESNNIWMTDRRHITGIMIALGGLITWELIQGFLPKAHFDLNDILWTCLGCLTFYFIWRIVPKTIRQENIRINVKTETEQTA